MDEAATATATATAGGCQLAAAALCGMKLPLPIVARVWRAEDANDGSGEDG